MLKRVHDENKRGKRKSERGIGGKSEEMGREVLRRGSRGGGVKREQPVRLCVRASEMPPFSSAAEPSRGNRMARGEGARGAGRGGVFRMRRGATGRGSMLPRQGENVAFWLRLHLPHLVFGVVVSLRGGNDCAVWISLLF